MAALRMPCAPTESVATPSYLLKLVRFFPTYKTMAVGILRPCEQILENHNL